MACKVLFLLKLLHEECTLLIMISQYMGELIIEADLSMRHNHGITHARIVKL